MEAVAAAPLPAGPPHGSRQAAVAKPGFMPFLSFASQATRPVLRPLSQAGRATRPG